MARFTCPTSRGQVQATVTIPRQSRGLSFMSRSRACQSFCVIPFLYRFYYSNRLTAQTSIPLSGFGNM